ncbi:3' terminal RNA ribose 2'-O-methyltransferase Hen1 [Plantibacter flavus]|uniref:Small RNA 2'-O-methyltransferase n=1 Tax=Plantibacter flavus TaxID=150123 RepID=A0A3N2C812_9MICO|nr:3' terminal RNA ribose 2'-O-methyltransferase Hen1 [Plantibacter flavus]ROR83641.1 3' terminal RNA ribose 2'-O-methyltransferase Hen1 [Plantibacter flavus]SMG25748.1 3' terminal RNA ribose 2'-O-methyltransferase Hen1 [Plantibacter flavus]
MLVTITSTAPSAADLGHLVRKHPARAQSFDLSVGCAHVFYPEATDERCTIALLLEVDAIALVRQKRFGGGDSASLSQYVNDRPYASSSMVAVAIGQVFRSAMTGRSDSHPELAAAALPLTITVAAVPSRGLEQLATRLFSPLGWTVVERAIPLDPTVPAWGDSRYVDLELTGHLRLADALRQLYVLLPVLDDAKHYWVSDDEVGKLLRAGEGWLADHPDRDLITKRYLAHQSRMITDAQSQLDPEARTGGADGDDAATASRTKRAPALAGLRAEAVLQALTDVRARSVADVGCGEGALLTRLLADPLVTTVIGTDVSARALASASQRLGLRDASDRVRERIQLLQSSATYADTRLRGLDAIVLMEVVEHIDAERLDALEASIFGAAAPEAVIVTTPNREYNALYPSLPAGSFRHPDHRFEWDRQEFATWCTTAAERYGYGVEHRTVGDVDPQLGSPTQLAIFRKAIS